MNDWRRMPPKEVAPMPRTPTRRPRPAPAAPAPAPVASATIDPLAPVMPAKPNRPGIEAPGVRKSANTWWCPEDGTGQKVDRNGGADDCPICHRSLAYYEDKYPTNPPEADED